MLREAWLVAGAALALACQRSNPATNPTDSAQEMAIPEGGTERPKRLVLGLTPFLSEEQMLREYRPLADYLAEKIGLPIELQVAPSYSDLSGMLTRYQFHLAILAPFNYVQAKRDNPDLILLATHIADGSSTYAAYIVTRERNGFQALNDLAGKRFAFVDKHSTSGYLYPLAHLRSAGIEPESFFGSIVYAGNHERLIDMVLSGKVDAGATYSTAYKMAADKGLRILAKTGRIPFDAYVASPRLDQALVGQIRDVLLQLNTRTDDGRRMLGRLTNINGFVQVGDDHYDEVRRVETLSMAHP
jgi:phosphonate transport system substrate-binding protein